jgi:transcription initiation factor TFIID subunit TAF12
MLVPFLAHRFVILRQNMQNLAREQNKRNPALNIDINKIKPSPQQWEQFNEKYKKGWKWIGHVPKLNQMSKNTFFKDMHPILVIYIKDFIQTYH